MRILTHYMEILDCLGGDITGDYEADKKRAEESADATFGQEDYDYAYQISEQP